MCCLHGCLIKFPPRARPRKRQVVSKCARAARSRCGATTWREMRGSAGGRSRGHLGGEPAPVPLPRPSLWRLVTTLRALTASTIPQVYVDGEFLGGCDVMIEMYQSGELAQI